MNERMNRFICRVNKLYNSMMNNNGEKKKLLMNVKNKIYAGLLLVERWALALARTGNCSAKFWK